MPDKRPSSSSTLQQAWGEFQGLPALGRAFSTGLMQQLQW
jgi:hypothetical protein